MRARVLAAVGVIVAASTAIGRLPARAQSLGAIDPAGTRAYCTSVMVGAPSAGSWRFDERRNLCVFRGAGLDAIAARLRGGHHLHRFSGPNRTVFAAMLLEGSTQREGTARTDGRVEYRPANPDTRHLVRIQADVVEILTIYRYTAAWAHFFGSDAPEAPAVSREADVATRERCAAAMVASSGEAGQWQFDELRGLCVFRGAGVFVTFVVEDGGHVVHNVFGVNRQVWVHRFMGPVRRLAGTTATMRDDGAPDGSSAYAREDESAIILVRVDGEVIWISLIERGTRTWDRNTAQPSPTVGSRSAGSL